MTCIFPATPSFGGPPAEPDPSPGAGEAVGGEPPSSGVPKRDWLIGGIVVVLLLAVLAATVGWRAVRSDDETAAPQPSTTTTPPTTEGEQPASWPIEIQPLVEFVEQHRGGRFDHPVPIEYLEETDYEAAVNASSSEDTEQDKADTASWTAQLQALGLLAPGIDIDAALDQLQGEGTLAFYDDDTEEIKVLGSNFDVAHRVTLVHELTHAWQDQHGFIEKIDELDDTEAFTLRALAEGDASRIEDEYVDTLSSRETNQYAEQSREQAGEVDLTGVPDVLVASLQSPYALGQPFVDVLDTDGGNPGVDAALDTPPPSEADLVDAPRYLDDTQPVEVTEPALPAGAERLDSGTFGALSWFFTLSEHNDPRQVLDMVDDWGGDSYVIYRQDGRACSAEAYRGSTPAAQAAAEGLMRTWADASPALSPTVETVGADLVLRSCEPVAGTPAPAIAGRSQLALGFAAIKAQAFSEAYSSGASIEQSSCFSDFIVDHISPEQMQSGATNDPGTIRQLGQDASAACL